MELRLEDADLVINVVVGQHRESIHIRNSVKIDQGNLPKEFTEQPSWFAWYSTLLAEQEDRLKTAERELEQRAASLALQLRQGKLKLDDNGTAKLTDKGIDAYINNDNEYIALQEKVQQYELSCKKLRALVQASVQRKDMLVQLGYLEAAERKQMPMSNGMRLG